MYTPLNTSREKMCREFTNNELKEVDIRNLYLVRDQSRIDKSKYYGSHKSHDHDTNECIHLKDVIEEPIEKEWLTG